MSEQSGLEIEVGNGIEKVDLYRNPDYVSLYRYENPTVPYDEKREGIVSKKGIVGSWYTDNLAALKTYTIARIRGQRGGKFVIVRVKREDLDKYDATKLSETKDMDIERDNYIVPPAIGESSRVEVDGIFKDNWQGRKNIPFVDWKEIEGYINSNLSDEAIITRLEK